MIYDDILKAIREEYNKGATQAELSKKYGCSGALICNLLSGKRSIGKISMKTFFKIFPRAQINIDSGVQTPGLNIGHMSDGNFREEDFTVKILADETLSNDEKVKFLKVLISK